jgi:hypothetical protein
VDHILLLGPKPVGHNEIALAQAFEPSKPSVESLNHFLFAIQALARGHFPAGTKNSASRFLESQVAFQFSDANVTSSVTQSFG